MTIAQTVAAIQAVNAAITGVTSTPDGTTGKEIPGQVETALLPLVLCWPAPLDMASAARDTIEADRTYHMAFLLAGEAAGVGINANVALVWDYLEKARSAWYVYAVDGTLLSGGQAVTRYHDAGGESILLTYRGKQWVGFLAEIDVWEPTL